MNGQMRAKTVRRGARCCRSLRLDDRVSGTCQAPRPEQTVRPPVFKVIKQQMMTMCGNLCVCGRIEGGGRHWRRWPCSTTFRPSVHPSVHPPRATSTTRRARDLRTKRRLVEKEHRPSPRWACACPLRPSSPSSSTVPLTFIYGRNTQKRSQEKTEHGLNDCLSVKLKLDWSVAKLADQDRSYCLSQSHLKCNVFSAASCLCLQWKCTVLHWNNNDLHNCYLDFGPVRENSEKSSRHLVRRALLIYTQPQSTCKYVTSLLSTFLSWI